MRPNSIIKSFTILLLRTNFAIFSKFTAWAYVKFKYISFLIVPFSKASNFWNEIKQHLSSVFIKHIVLTFSSSFSWIFLILFRLCRFSQLWDGFSFWTRYFLICSFSAEEICLITCFRLGSDPGQSFDRVWDDKSLSCCRILSLKVRYLLRLAVSEEVGL